MGHSLLLLTNARNTAFVSVASIHCPSKAPERSRRSTLLRACAPPLPISSLLSHTYFYTHTRRLFLTHSKRILLQIRQIYARPLLSFHPVSREFVVGAKPGGVGRLRDGRSGRNLLQRINPLARGREVIHEVHFWAANGDLNTFSTGRCYPQKTY